MRAVSSTTPLRYLIAIRHEHLLAQLFEKVLVPVAVYEELTDARTPRLVREMMLSMPAWLGVRSLQKHLDLTLPLSLHRGERDAIFLAEALSADVLLIDDYAGRSVALERGLPVSGTLGILERADAVGILNDFPTVLRELKSSGFFVGEDLEQLLLKRHRARKQ